MTRFVDLRERVVRANRALVDAGLVVLTFGNASAADREAGVIAIKPSGVACGDLRPEDVPIVDLVSGAIVDGTQRPSSDTPTHVVLYRAFPEVGGVVHTHSPFATAWAQACRDLPCLGTTHADHFRGSVPVTRALTPEEIAGEYEGQTGAVILATLAERGADPLELPAVLVASHGPFAWGADVEHAVENAVALEAVAASAFRALELAGSLDAISDELLSRHFDRKHGAAAYYGQST
ncbi:MAG: L-ribulose-5-phosphate 4-epimerase AraD [Actinobacteria bacterium]|nr:L-ribulose-5-phosphate 4-epimerase AraD [Actinomycetota bacterium]